MASRTKAKKTSKKKIDPTLQQVLVTAVVVLVMAVGTFVVIRMKAPKTASGTRPVDSAPAQSAPAAQKQYSGPADMQLDPSKPITATFTLAKGGQFVAELYPDKAPLTVNSFVFLAREGYFDGTTFHRVLPGFMAQGGDPTGTGAGGPGYEFANEDSDLTFDKPGVLAMANAGRDTNGSQFFITFVPTPQLNGGYTIFGQVVSGMEVVNGITMRDPQQNPGFTGDVIQSVTIQTP